jgi:hypothetical protein
MVTGEVRALLRLEGVAYLAFALMAFVLLHGSWLTFIILFMAPDLSFLGYLAGPKVGAVSYNAMHSSIGPVLLVAGGYLFGMQELWIVACIWFAHIGFDRMLGYGLKYASGFKDTHLGRL